jgi:putative ABC transport system substrate-binding protein
MDRRDAIFALLALGTAPGSVNAQPAPPRLAYIGEGSALGGSTLALLRDGLHENGLADGKDYVIEPYWADGKYDRLPALVAAAIERKPSIILVATIAAVRAAQQATKTIPIVFLGTNDPVGSGLIASLARPGGNTTGVTSMNSDRAAKMVELVLEALPKAKRMAVLINPLNPSNRPIFQTMRSAAVRLGMTAEAFEADSPERIGSAFAALSKLHPDALLTGFDAMLYVHRAEIVSLGLANKIPVVSTSLVFSVVGALICFGAPIGAIYSRVGFYIKRILAGAKPADLPVEQPTRFELVLNLRSARTLGLAIPRAFLLRADRVIE